MGKLTLWLIYNMMQGHQLKLTLIYFRGHRKKLIGESPNLLSSADVCAFIPALLQVPPLFSSCSGTTCFYITATVLSGSERK